MLWTPMILAVDLKVLVKFCVVAVIGFRLSKALDVFANKDIERGLRRARH